MNNRSTSTNQRRGSLPLNLLNSVTTRQMNKPSSMIGSSSRPKWSIKSNVNDSTFNNHNFDKQRLLNRRRQSAPGLVLPVVPERKGMNVKKSATLPATENLYRRLDTPAPFKRNGKCEKEESDDKPDSKITGTRPSSSLSLVSGKNENNNRDTFFDNISDVKIDFCSSGSNTFNMTNRHSEYLHSSSSFNILNYFDSMKSEIEQATQPSKIYRRSSLPCISDRMQLTKSNLEMFNDVMDKNSTKNISEHSNQHDNVVE